MRQFKLLSLAFMAVLSLTGAITAAASATEPNILPEGTALAPLTGTSSSGLSSFGNGVITVESPASTGTFEGTSAKLGNFDALFTGSHLSGTEVKCTGLNDTTPGSILAKGTFHIRDYKKGTELRTAIIFLISPEIHFECGELLVIVKGCVAAALTPDNNTLVTSLTATLAKTAGDNQIVKVLNEANTAEENCELLSKEGAGVFKLSSEVTTQTLTGFKQSGSAVTVLVMPL
jgi:hypothetical protein